MQEQAINKPDWLLFHSILLLIGLVIDFALSSIFVCPIIALLSFIFFIKNQWEEFTVKKKWGGFPNLVTIFRLTLVLIAACFFNNLLILASIATLTVLLDGLDGYLARKLNQVTEFGGQLDMETDAFFVFVFSLLISLHHPDINWILLGGSMRYIYKIVTTVFSKVTFVETKKSYARYFAGVYFFSFVLFFYINYSYGKIFIIIGNIVVLFSFSISFYEFIKHKK